MRPNETQIGPKSIPESTFVFWLIWDEISNDFWCQNVSKLEEEADGMWTSHDKRWKSKNIKKLLVFQWFWWFMEKLSKNDVEGRLTTKMDFGYIFGRFWKHFGKENRLKSDQKPLKKGYKKRHAERWAKIAKVEDLTPLGSSIFSYGEGEGGGVNPSHLVNSKPPVARAGGIFVLVGRRPAESWFLVPGTIPITTVSFRFFW